MCRLCYTENMNMREFSENRICVAVSGGADSMALLHFMKTRAREDGFFLSAVNCEHGIRGKESLDDSRFVEEICREWEIPLFSFSADCPAEAERDKVSLETAARNFRYRCFSSLLGADADYIATAHHADDEAETVLFRLCRGAAQSGVKGMEPVSGNFLKPFLDRTKAEILQYVEREKIPFREDKTNFEEAATRNKLRLRILPELEKAIPGTAGNLARFARFAAEDDSFLYERSKELVKEVSPRSRRDTGLRIKFSDCPPLMRRACLIALKKVGIEKDYTSAHLEAVCALRNLQTGSRISLPDGIEAERTYDEIALFRGRNSEKAEKRIEKNSDGRNMSETDGAEEYIAEICSSPPSEETYFGKILRFDADSLPDTAVFRLKREGDRFEKFGGGSKPLKKYLIDKKIPKDIREELPVLAETQGTEVYAVCGVEISDKIKVSEKTERIKYIIVRKK